MPSQFSDIAVSLIPLEVEAGSRVSGPPHEGPVSQVSWDTRVEDLGKSGLETDSTSFSCLLQVEMKGLTPSVGIFVIPELQVRVL